MPICGLVSGRLGGCRRRQPPASGRDSGAAAPPRLHVNFLRARVAPRAMAPLRALLAWAALPGAVASDGCAAGGVCAADEAALLQNTARARAGALQAETTAAVATVEALCAHARRG